MAWVGPDFSVDLLWQSTICPGGRAFTVPTTLLARQRVDSQHAFGSNLLREMECFQQKYIKSNIFLTKEVVSSKVAINRWAAMKCSTQQNRAQLSL